jgi:histidine triad (HIT) family protein
VSDTIFGKIVAGEIPSEFLYEDDHCIAINDVNPQAPVHVLVIPRRGIPRLVDAQAQDQELLGHLLLAAGKVAEQLGVADAFRLIINNGAGAGQTVFHLHLHIIAGKTFAEGHMAG